MWDRGYLHNPPIGDGQSSGSKLNHEQEPPRGGSKGGSIGRNSESDRHSKKSDGNSNKGGQAPAGGGGPPGDDDDNDGDRWTDKDRKGKKPSRRLRTPWDDDSSPDESPSSPSSSSSSSEDSSSSDEDWFDALASNKHRLDKKTRRKLRRQAVKKLRAKSEDDKH